MDILVRVLGILLAIGIVVLVYYIVIWVLSMLGLVVPDQILKVVFVIVALAVAIAVLSGRFDYWKPKT